MSKDSASVAAEEAYGIYLGMIKGQHSLPSWSDLPRQTRGLLEWTARYARFSQESDRDTLTQDKRGTP